MKDLKTEDLKWIPVVSSNIVAVRYNRLRREMDVKFTSGTLSPGETFYRYSDVSMEEFIDTLQAESTGSYFSKGIKASKDVKKMGDPTTSRSDRT